jgi:6-phosphogluconolactonase
MKIIILLITVFTSTNFLMGQSSKEILYVGTSSERDSEGIYVFEFDRNNKDFHEIQTVTHKASPTFLELHPNGKFLYAVYREGLTKEDKNGTLSAFEINQTTGVLQLINEVSSEGAGPCHVSVDPQGEYVYVSNYGGGNLAVFPIKGNGSLEPASDMVQHTGSSSHSSRQKQPYMHSIIPAGQGDYIYASDLGVDKIFTYKIMRGSGKLSATEKSSVSSTPGSGPRHFTIHPSQNLAFSVEELSSTIASYQVNPHTGELKPFERVPMLSPDFPPGKTSTAADIHVSPDGKYLYASNRGDDTLVIYSIDAKSGQLTLVGHEPTQGAHPRNFYMDQAGDFVLVANKDDDHFVMFDRDKYTGKLEFTGREVTVPAAVCLKLLSLP